MNIKSQQLLRSVLSLPESERAEMAAALISSLETSADEDADSAWAAEIQRRIDSIDNGDVRPIPWDTVMDEMGPQQNG